MLTNKVLTRVELPQEPGEWIEVRAPSFFIVQDCIGDEGTDWLKMFVKCITAWSYPDEVTPDNISELDTGTVTLLIGQLTSRQGPDAEKKDGPTSTEPLTATGKPRKSG